MPEIKAQWLEELSEIRDRLANGDKAEQPYLDKVQEQWKDRCHLLRPGEKDEEFQLVDAEGKSRDLRTRRWLCHLLGLRHRCAHVLLRWTTPGLGRLLVLQVRSWTKSDSAGRIDISVGGHVVGSTTAEQTAYDEMDEELGIAKDDLLGAKLIRRTGYRNVPDERPAKNFYNVEWRDVYVGDLIPGRIEKLRFNDQEAVGLYLCPELEARNLLEQETIPIASALKQYLGTLPGGEHAKREVQIEGKPCMLAQ